jgi:uncharacterized membrane protein
VNGVIQQAVDLEVAARTAYDQFTQFLDYPRFVQVLEMAEQLDDSHVRGLILLGGKELMLEWEICEQIPDKRIAWKSVKGPRNSGVVTFHRIGDGRSRIMLQVELVPRAVRVAAAAEIERVLDNFKRFIEQRGQATGAWRGSIPSKDERD